MSYLEAKEDGIHMEKHGGNDWDYPSCKICGAPVPSWNYLRNVEYTCRECRKMLVEAAMEQTRDKKEKKLKQAVKRISKVTDIAKYEAARQTVRKNLDKPLWFQSTEEIMVALELLRQGVKTHHQVKVYDYRVDFLLPEYKGILEIDGSFYHRKDMEAASEIRDEVIMDKFENEWEVIHIQAENIDRNVTKLLPAIKAVLKRRKKIRGQYDSP